MADQLITLGLDEKEYQQGLKSLMRQTRADMAKMRADVERTGKSSGGLWNFAAGYASMAVLRKGWAMASNAMQAYARTSQEAARQVESAWRPIEQLQADLGGSIAPIVRTVAENARAAYDWLVSGGRESYELSLKAQRAEDELIQRRQRDRQEQARAIDAQTRLLQLEAGVLSARASGAGGGDPNLELQSDILELMARGMRSQDDRAQRLERGEITPRMAEIEARAQFELGQAQARAAIQKRDKALAEARERDAKAVRDELDQMLDDARQREDQLDRLRDDELALRAQILLEQGRRLDSDRLSVQREREARRKAIESMEGLTERERQDAIQRSDRLMDDLAAARGLRPDRDPLVRIESGTSGLGSVLAGSFGRNLNGAMGGEGTKDQLQRIREAGLKTAENTKRTVDLLTQLVTRAATAVYG